ncbi:hypothetical protein K445DRAFT_17715 [Daldinia sp. EC12]|nr:hypothetical protein K445DRAFT_17715 [Daldinia sp. EC12]
MISLHSLTAFCSLFISSIWALPHPFGTVTVTADDSTETPFGYGYPPASTPTPTPFTNLTSSEAVPMTTMAPLLSSASSSSSSRANFTGHCDYSFCNSGSNVCFYWAGYTSWDVSRGPIPGEIPTILGPC